MTRLGRARRRQRRELAASVTAFVVMMGVLWACLVWPVR